MANLETKRAVLSVNKVDKQSIDPLAKALDVAGFELFASEGTAEAITSVKSIRTMRDLLTGTPYETSNPMMGRESAALYIADMIGRDADEDGLDFGIGIVCVSLSPAPRDAKIPHVDRGGQVLLEAGVESRIVTLSQRDQYPRAVETLLADEDFSPAYRAELHVAAQWAVASYVMSSAQALERYAAALREPVAPAAAA